MYNQMTLERNKLGGFILPHLKVYCKSILIIMLGVGTNINRLRIKNRNICTLSHLVFHKTAKEYRKK